MIWFVQRRVFFPGLYFYTNFEMFTFWFFLLRACCLCGCVGWRFFDVVDLQWLGLPGDLLDLQHQLQPLLLQTPQTDPYR